MTRPLGFLHERLDAYHVSLDLVEAVAGLLKSYPRGLAKERDQVRRSAGSVVRNLAEGANRRTPADKAQYLGIALAECAETHASLQLATRCGYVPSAAVEPVLELCGRVGAMLTGLLRVQRRRSGAEPKE